MPDKKLIARALKEGFELIVIDGQLYALAEYPPAGWWVYKLEWSASEYFVSKDTQWCSCPVEGECKHQREIRKWLECVRSRATSSTSTPKTCQ